MENIAFDQLEELITEQVGGCWDDLDIGQFIKIYPFTTENIAGYINVFDLKDRTLLTVGSSGDQVINAALYDCTDITLLDINPFTKFYVYLKIACLLELDRSKFMNFLRYNKFSKKYQKNNNCFHKGVYKAIRRVLEMLDNESFMIWEKLFDSFNSLEIRNSLFSFDEYSSDVLKVTNPYLASDEAYEKTKAKIQKTDIKFLIGDICGVELKEKYDNIWLSNICQYFLVFDGIKSLVDKMANHLNDGGQLLISYLYGVSSSTPSTYIETKPIYQVDKLKNKLKEYSLSFPTFVGVNRIIDSSAEERNDSIIYYKK